MKQRMPPGMQPGVGEGMLFTDYYAEES